MSTWRVYYTDGSTFSNQDGAPYEAPGWGIAAIIQYGGDWWGHDLAGLLDCLALPGTNIVLHGRSMPKGEWSDMLKKVDRDPDFPPRDDRYIMHGWDHYCWHGGDG